MATRIIDVDTSVRPFRTVQPTRYTLTDEDTVRVSVALDLAEYIGGDKFDQTIGLDVVTLLDGETSDAERSQAVRDVISRNKFVTGFIAQPEVTLATADDGTPQVRIVTEVDTVFGPVSLEF